LRSIESFVFITVSMTVALLMMSLIGNSMVQKVSALCTSDPKTANGPIACRNDPTIGTGAATSFKNGHPTNFAEILNGHFCAQTPHSGLICAR